MATPAPLKAASNCRVGAEITGRAFRLGVGGGRATEVAVAEDAVVLELLGIGAGGSEVLAARAACWRAWCSRIARGALGIACFGAAAGVAVDSDGPADLDGPAATDVDDPPTAARATTSAAAWA